MIFVKQKRALRERFLSLRLGQEMFVASLPQIKMLVRAQGDQAWGFDVAPNICWIAGFFHVVRKNIGLSNGGTIHGLLNCQYMVIL